MAGDTHGTTGVGVPGVTTEGALTNMDTLTKTRDLCGQVSDAGVGAKLTQDAVDLANELKKVLGPEATQ